MSKKIKPGILVRVVGTTYPENYSLIGMVSRVESVDGVCNITGKPLAFLAGDMRFNAYRQRMGFKFKNLEPINPDNEQSTWEEVQKLTNWNPAKVTV